MNWWVTLSRHDGGRRIKSHLCDEKKSYDVSKKDRIVVFSGNNRNGRQMNLLDNEPLALPRAAEDNSRFGDEPQAIFNLYRFDFLRRRQ